ncbi:MAG: LamG domain-containing protein [Acidobacteriota bacterium]
MRILLVLLVVGCGRIGFDPRATDGAGADAVDDGLVAYYPMDDLAGGATVDATGHGHTATCAMMPPPQGECPTVVAGHIGNALAFDGATTILRVASTPELATASGFTIATWVDLASAPASRACFATKGLGTAIYNSWAACIEPARTIFFYSVTGATVDNLFSIVTVSTGAWHHIAIRWDGATKTISLDGADVIADTAKIDFDSQDVYIGSDIDNGAFAAPYAGALDDLRIYNRALAADEIAALAAR